MFTFNQQPPTDMQASANAAKQYVAASEVRIMGSPMLHELMTRNGYFLPRLESRFCTQKMLLRIRDGEVWCPKQEQIVLRQCTRPPSVQVLVQKLQHYLQPHRLESGISLKKENFPDKNWLILAIATVSGGKDEIFQKDYIPQPHELKPNAPVKEKLLANEDGVLTIPDGIAAIYSKKGGRTIQMVALTKEDKIKAQLQLEQQKMERIAQRQQKLQQELAEAKRPKNPAADDATRELTIKEMREELQRHYEEQAQKFVSDELERKGQLIAERYNKRWEEETQRLLQENEAFQARLLQQRQASEEREAED